MPARLRLANKESEVSKFFIVSYDLFNQKDYDKIEERIKSVSTGFLKPLYTVYIIRSPIPLLELRTKLEQSLDNDDRMLVVEVDVCRIASYNLEDEAIQWIERNC